MHEILSFLKYLITTNAFNFILMLVIFGWIIKKVNIGQILAKGISQVESSIQKSEQEKLSAQNHLKSAQNLIDKLPEDIKELDKNCNDKVEAFKNQIIESTKQTIQNLEQSIEKSISIEEKKISNLITESVAKSTVEEATEKIISIFDSNPELHQKFIQKSIDELDKVKL